MAAGWNGTHSCFVRRIDKQDEPPRLVLGIESQLRHPAQKDGSKRLCDLEVIRRRVRRAAQVVERELGDVRSRERDPDRPSPHGEFAILYDFVARIDARARGFEQLVELGLVCACHRVEVDPGQLARPFAIVCEKGAAIVSRGHVQQGASRE